MSKLSLITRKNLKENDEKINELKAAIQQHTGISSEVNLEMDQIEFAAFIEKNGYKDRLGEAITWYLEGISSNFKRQFADDAAKAAIQAAWTTGVLRFVLATNKKNENFYNKIAVDNGDLVLSIYSVSNSSDAGANLLNSLGDASGSGLSIKAALNLKENEEKKNEIIESIKEITGVSSDIQLEGDWVEFAAFVDKAGYNDRLGEAQIWYLEGIQSNFKRQFSDEIAKAALQAAWTTGIIRFVLATNKKNENFYNKTAIDNGDLVVSIYSVSNSSDAGHDLLNQLPDASGSGLTIKAALNVKENEEKKTEIIESIKELTGVTSDVTVEGDWVEFAAFVDKNGYKDRVGEAQIWYLEGLQSNFKRHFADEIAKAALQAAWTTGIIRFVLATNKKNENFYNKTAVDNGDLVLSIYSVSNSSDAGHDLLNQLGDASGSGLSIKAALNVKENEEKKTEAIEGIKEATGVTSDITVDFNLVELSALTDKAGYKDRVGEAQQWILEGLRDNLKRVCREELTKEAIAEAWTTGVIRLEANPKINYWDVSLEDGNLTIFYNPKNYPSNTSDIGSNIESKL